MLHAKYWCIYWASKGAVPLFEQSEPPTPKHCFLSSLVENDLVVLEKNIFKHFPIYYYVKA